MTTQDVTTTHWKATFKLNALDLNQDMVYSADAAITTEDRNELDRGIAAHWLLRDPMYTGQLQELTNAARAVHSSAGVVDERTDSQLVASILMALHLWDEKEPTGVWGHGRFMAKFLAAYGRFMFRAEFVKGRLGVAQPEHAMPETT